MQSLYFEPSELFIAIMVPLFRLFAFSCLIFLTISFIFFSSEFWYFYLFVLTILIMRIIIQNCWLCSLDIGQRNFSLTVLGVLATVSTPFEDRRICFAESGIYLSQHSVFCSLSRSSPPSLSLAFC